MKKEWYRQTLEIPMIIDDTGAWFFCDNRKNRARTASYSDRYKPMDKKEWLRRFYS
jgi:hypothetical protein